MYPDMPPAKRPAVRDTPAVARARAVCKTCPVVGECLAHALRLEARDLVGHDSFRRFPRAGVFAGMTPRERLELHQRRRIRQAERLWQARRLRCPGSLWTTRGESVCDVTVTRGVAA